MGFRPSNHPSIIRSSVHPSSARPSVIRPSVRHPREGACLAPVCEELISDPWETDHGHGGRHVGFP